jgi:hypothetical protein
VTSAILMSLVLDSGRRTVVRDAFSLMSGLAPIQVDGEMRV